MFVKMIDGYLLYVSVCKIDFIVVGCIEVDLVLFVGFNNVFNLFF